MSANDRDDTASTIPSTTGTSLQAARESYTERHARISVAVSLIDPAKSIETPLGRYCDGRWVPLPKLESVFDLSPDNLADDLSADGLIGDLLQMDHKEVLELLHHTHRRCFALAEARRSRSSDSRLTWALHLSAARRGSLANIMQVTASPVGCKTSEPR